MKKIFNYITVLIICSMFLALSACEPTEFDGLNVVDPLPDVPITFPQAIGWDDRMQVSWNAFTFEESITDGEVTVRLKVPDGFTIQSISEVRGQRIRGNLGPRYQGGRLNGSSRFPSRFDRGIAPNYGVDFSVTPGSEVAWNLSLTALNALPSGSLGDIAVGDGLRLFFTISLSDGREFTSAEARVILTE